MAEDKRILKDHNGGMTGSVFTTHFRNAEKLEKELRDVQARIKANDQKAKDDGVDIKAMKDAAKLRLKDPQAQIDHENKVTQYLRWLRTPLGEQRNFIDDLGGTETLTGEERMKFWRNEGFQAGISARNRDTCPHDPNTEAGQEWAKGYEEGQAENAAGISDGKGNVVSMPAKRKGGRKKQEAAPSGEAEGNPAEAGDAAPEASGDAPSAPDAPEAPDAPPVTDAEWEAAAPKGAA